MPQTIGQYPRLRYHLHHLLLAMLLTRCCLILFVNHLYLQYRSVHYSPCISPFPSLSLMFEQLHLLLMSRPYALTHLLLILATSYTLLFSIVLQLLLPETLHTIALSITRHYYPLHSL